MFINQKESRFRVRVQSRLLGKPMLVLQVRAGQSTMMQGASGDPLYMEGEGWRDAQLEDLIEFNSQPQQDLKPPPITLLRGA